jgi:putative transposase
MPRIARTIVTNVPYHITQRGNRRQDVFFSPEQRQQYLDWLLNYSSIYHFDIIAYCLMTNHIHLVGIPRKQESMSRTIQTVHMRHSQVVNREMGWYGHLWHSRYFSSPLDHPYLFNAVRYIEQNPVRAGLVNRAEDYPWSSASFHCGLQNENVGLFMGDELGSMFEDWGEVLAESSDVKTDEIIRKRTMSGIPCGDSKFVKMISRKTGRIIVERKRGRPRKG